MTIEGVPYEDTEAQVFQLAVDVVDDEKAPVVKVGFGVDGVLTLVSADSPLPTVWDQDTIDWFVGVVAASGGASLYSALFVAVEGTTDVDVGTFTDIDAEDLYEVPLGTVARGDIVGEKILIHTGANAGIWTVTASGPCTPQSPQPLGGELVAITVTGDRPQLAIGSNSVGFGGETDATATATEFTPILGDLYAQVFDLDLAVAALQEGTLSTVVSAGTTVTLDLSCAGKVVELDNASPISVTVPPNSDVALAVGVTVELWAQGAGEVTIVAGSGVTLRSPGGKLKIDGQYGTAVLRKRATDEWAVEGRLKS